MTSDVETGYTLSEDSALRSDLSSFESTQEEEDDFVASNGKNTFLVPKIKKKTKLNKVKLGFLNRSSKKSNGNTEEENVEWVNYVNDEVKHLIKKCRKKSRRTRHLATIFALIDDLIGLYLIFFSVATFITGAIQEEYGVQDYIIIGLSGIATFLEAMRLLFKPKKRSLYFKQSNINYKRVYRKLTKYFYTSKNTDDMAHYLSMAYRDVDNLALNDHQANFNTYNNSYKIRLQKNQGSK